MGGLGDGVQNVLLKGGDKPEKGGCFVNGEVATVLLLYSSITFAVSVGKVGFPLLLFGYSVFSICKPCKISIQVFSVLKPDVVCTFLIHSGSLENVDCFF